jgi:hypothetical protein
MVSGPHNPTITNNGDTASIEFAGSGSYVFEVQVDAVGGCVPPETATFAVTVTCPLTLTGTSLQNVAAVTSTYANGYFGGAQLYSSITGQAADAYDEVVSSFYWRFETSPADSMFGGWYNISYPTTVTVTNSTDPSAYTFTYTTETEECVLIEDVHAVLAATTEEYYIPDDRHFVGCFHPDVKGTYSMKLTVSDLCLRTFEKTATVTAQCNAAPTAAIAAADSEDLIFDKTGFARVQLDGSASADADNDALYFKWDLTDAPEASAFYYSIEGNDYNTTSTNSLPPNGREPRALSDLITNDRAAIASFVPDAKGIYTFQLTVSDGCTTVKTTADFDVTCSGTVSISAASDGIRYVRSTIGSPPVPLTASEPCATRYEWKLTAFEEKPQSLVASAGTVTVSLLFTVLAVILAVL